MPTSSWLLYSALDKIDVLTSHEVRLTEASAGSLNAPFSRESNTYAKSSATKNRFTYQSTLIGKEQSFRGEFPLEALENIS